MSEKNKKIIIGLTGNIATGKSVVRKMLQILGAYGIDADSLGHRAIAKGAPGYHAVLNEFGNHILGKDMEIDRKKLGKIVFSNPSALKILEGIVHPLVRQAANFLIKNSIQDVIVIEAIKLLESPIKEMVDHIWVTTTIEENQLKRLAEKRGIPEKEAQAIMASQSSQDDKVRLASTIIINDGSFEDTWNQVQNSWYELFPEEFEKRKIRDTDENADIHSGQLAEGLDFKIIRATPSYAEDIGKFIAQNNITESNFNHQDVMQTFGERAYMLLISDNNIAGVVGWQVENLVATIDEIWLNSQTAPLNGLGSLIQKIEEASRELQAEAILIIADPGMAEKISKLNDTGFQIYDLEDLKINAWKDAARGSIKKNSVVLFKQLRVDRIMRPI